METMQGAAAESSTMDADDLERRYRLRDTENQDIWETDLYEEHGDALRAATDRNCEAGDGRPDAPVRWEPVAVQTRCQEKRSALGRPELVRKYRLRDDLNGDVWETEQRLHDTQAQAQAAADKANRSAWRDNEVGDPVLWSVVCVLMSPDEKPVDTTTGTPDCASGAGATPDGGSQARVERPAGTRRRLPGGSGVTGVFTDGSATPNPGQGGWGVVWVEDGEIVDERHGQTEATTNNRMELQALIEAFRMLPADTQIDVVSDSNLCVQTVNQWAPAWRRAGWRRQRGTIANLDLVKSLLTLAEAHPRCTVKWTRSHAANPGNEYADGLANRRTA